MSLEEGVTPKESEEMTALLALADIREALGCCGHIPTPSRLAEMVRWLVEELDKTQDRLDEAAAFGDECARLILHHVGQEPLEQGDEITDADVEAFLSEHALETEEMMLERDALRAMIRDLRRSDDDKQIIARTCIRYVTKANAGDDVTCRWCRKTGYAHHQDCPVNAMIDISSMLIGDDASRRLLEEALKETS